MSKAWSTISRGLGVAGALALGGCMVGPDFHRPAAPAKDAYAIPAVAAATAPLAQQLQPGQDIPGQWWTLFHSPALNALVQRALSHNPDLDAAQQALRGAWETSRIDQAALLPSVDASFSPSRNKTAGTYSSATADNSYLYNLHTAQVSVSYTPDIWGGARRQLESSRAQAEQQRFQLEATYLTLTTNLVNAAIQEASLRGQIEATEAIIASQREVLDSSLRQRQLGQLDDADVAVQQAALAQAQASLPPLRKQLAQQHDLIAALAGGTPEDATPAFTLDQLVLPGQLPVSLPAQLIEQRPDVRAAEAAWHAASAQVGVALADRLPNLSLSADAGSAAETIHNLFSHGTGFWALAGNLGAPLFDGGVLRHRERAARDAAAQAADGYRSTVIGSLQNVADSLHAIAEDADALSAEQRADQASARSLALAQRQLSLGDVSQTQLWAAEQTRAQARIALVQAQAARYADTVALFQSLGGGWWNRHDVQAPSRK